MKMQDRETKLLFSDSHLGARRLLRNKIANSDKKFDSLPLLVLGNLGPKAIDIVIQSFVYDEMIKEKRILQL
jgi:hypothetical protein